MDDEKSKWWIDQFIGKVEPVEMLKQLQVAYQDYNKLSIIKHHIIDAYVTWYVSEHFFEFKKIAIQLFSLSSFDYDAERERMKSEDLNNLCKHDNYEVISDFLYAINREKWNFIENDIFKLRLENLNARSLDDKVNKDSAYDATLNTLTVKCWLAHLHAAPNYHLQGLILTVCAKSRFEARQYLLKGLLSRDEIGPQYMVEYLKQLEGDGIALASTSASADGIVSFREYYGTE
jgi:hypothetical protein